MSINLNVALPTSVFKVLNLRQTRILTALTILSVFLAISFAAQRTSAAGAAYVWIDPPQESVGVGEVFNVSIHVDNLLPEDRAAGFQVFLTWNPSVLIALNSTEVLFHSVTPPDEWGNIWILMDKINNTIGFAQYGYLFQNSRQAVEAGYAPITGNHTLATYTFQAVNTGYTILDLFLIKIGDVDANAVPWTKADGEVTVGDVAPPIAINAPANGTYFGTSSVDLSFKISKQPVAWIGYSLDQKPNITIQGETEIQTVDGQHSIVVYANDSEGRMGVSNAVFFITDTTPPTVSLVYSPSPPQAEPYHGSFRWVLLFNASASQDATTNVSSFYWDFGDGTNTTNVASQHVYREPGSYHVTLSISDFLGNSASQETTLTITPASNPLEIPYGLIVAIVIPAVWIPSLLYYFSRTKRTRALRRKAQLR